MKASYQEVIQYGEDVSAIESCFIEGMTLLDVSHCGLDDERIGILCEALQSSPHAAHITHIDLSNNNITPDGAKTIAQLLKKKEEEEKNETKKKRNSFFSTLLRLDLWDNQLGGEGYAILGDVLGDNPSLTHLDLAGNKLGHQQDELRTFTRGLEVNTGLRWLSLRDNQLGVLGAKTLSFVFRRNRTLTYLDVSDNAIQNSGAKMFSNGVDNAIHLHELDLSSNGLSAGGVRATFIALEEHPSLLRMHVSDCRAGKDGADAIGQALGMNKVLQELYMSDSGLGPEGGSLVAQGVARNQVLRVLNVSYSKLMEQGSVAMAHAVMQHPTLTHINMAGNDVGQLGIEALAEMLRKNTILTFLDLGECNIGADGMVILCRALLQGGGGNTTLQSLLLYQDGAEDEGAMAIADVIKHHPTLTELDISSNSIGDDGTQAIANALSTSSTSVLRVLHYGANTCTPDGSIPMLLTSLARHPHLENVSMVGNEVSEDNIRVMEDEVTQNTSLTRWRCNIESKIINEVVERNLQRRKEKQEGEKQ